MPAAPVVVMGYDGIDILDDAGLDPGLELEIVGAGVALVAHLGDDIGILFGRVD